MRWLVVRYIHNPRGLDHIAMCGQYATRYDAEKSAQLFAEAHNQIAGTASFVVREMRQRQGATE